MGYIIRQSRSIIHNAGTLTSDPEPDNTSPVAGSARLRDGRQAAVWSGVFETNAINFLFTDAPRDAVTGFCVFGLSTTARFEPFARIMLQEAAPVAPDRIEASLFMERHGAGLRGYAAGVWDYPEPGFEPTYSDQRPCYVWIGGPVGARLSVGEIIAGEREPIPTPSSLTIETVFPEIRNGDFVETIGAPFRRISASFPPSRMPFVFPTEPVAWWPTEDPGKAFFGRFVPPFSVTETDDNVFLQSVVFEEMSAPYA